MKWKRTGGHKTRKECLLHAEVTLDFMGETTPMIVFGKTVIYDELLDIVVEQSNIYATQSGRAFITNREEMSAFLGINYIMSINKLPTLKSYWQADVFIGNEGIQNVMTRARFLEILRNLHFADNTQHDGLDKGNLYICL